MPGTLKVGGNTIATHTGVEGAGTVSANNVSLGSNVQFPAGHVLQIQRGYRNLNVSHGGADFVEILSKSITTISNNSKILVMYESFAWANGPANMYTYTKLNRTGGSSGDGDLTDINGTTETTFQNAAQGITANHVHTLEKTFTYEDSPSVSAGTELIYKTFQNTGGETLGLGANCFIILFEIAA